MSPRDNSGSSASAADTDTAAQGTRQALFEITTLSKLGGPLTKLITLGPDDRIKSDGSACVMGRGSARRTLVTSMAMLADHIAALAENEAITLGRLADGLRADVEITTKRNPKTGAITR